jgi:hypothetical protein
MAINRFFQPGQSGYQSQYVPMKMPFQQWDDKLKQADASIDTAKQEWAALQDTGITGSKELSLPNSVRGYYGDAITQEFKNLGIQDYNKSVQSKQNLDNFISGMTDDDFIMSVGNGEFADKLIQGNKMYKQHVANNAVYDARTKWKQDADKELAKHGDDLTNSPWLATGYKQELLKMQEDPSYVPTSTPIIGKSMDRSKELISQVNVLKNEGYRGEDINTGGLYKKWSSKIGRSGSDYEKFAANILEDNNSKIRRDIEAQVDAHIQDGLLDESQRDAAIDFEINKLIETAGNLEHQIVKSGTTAKSEFTFEQENAAAPMPVPDLKEAGDYVSYNTIEDRANFLTSEMPRLQGMIDALPVGSAKRNVYENQLAGYKSEALELKANIIQADKEIKSTFGESINTVADQNVSALMVQYPDAFKNFLIPETDAEGNVSGYTFDERNFNHFVRTRGIKTNYIQEYKQAINDKISTPEGVQAVSTLNKSNKQLQAYTNMYHLLSTDALNSFRDNGVIMSNDIETPQEGQEILLKMGYSQEDIADLNKTQMADLITTDLNKGKKFKNNIDTANKNSDRLNNLVSDAKNNKVRQNPYDYYDMGATSRTISSGELGYVATALDVTNSYVELPNGTKITDPILLEKIAASIANEGEDRIGVTTRDGKVVLKEGISKFDLMTQDQIDLELAEGDIEVGTKKYQAWLKEKKETPAEINKVVLSSGYNSQIKTNSINTIVKSDASTDYKATEVGNIMNEGSLNRMTDINNQMIISTEFEETGQGNFTKNVDELIVFPTFDVNGNRTPQNDEAMRILEVEMTNYVGGTPTYTYTIYQEDAGTVTFEVDSPNSRELIKKISDIKYGPNK